MWEFEISGALKSRGESKVMALAVFVFQMLVI